MFLTESKFLFGAVWGLLQISGATEREHVKILHCQCQRVDTRPDLKSYNFIARQDTANARQTFRLYYIESVPWVNLTLSKILVFW